MGVIKPSFGLDKCLLVQPHHIVKTKYVPVDDIVLECKSPMAIGDVAAKYELVKQNAPGQGFPCPIGYWGQDERFHLVDGRHTYLAYVMNGYTHVLVSWQEEIDGP